jgi:glycine cleavage system regulatory protein
MLLTQILQQKSVKVPLEGKDKESVITELVELLDSNGVLLDKDAALEAKHGHRLWNRDTTRQMQSGQRTGYGFGNREGGD